MELTVILTFFIVKYKKKPAHISEPAYKKRGLNPKSSEFINHDYLVKVIFFTSTKLVPSIPEASILYR